MHGISSWFETLPNQFTYLCQIPPVEAKLHPPTCAPPHHRIHPSRPGLAQLQFSNLGAHERYEWAEGELEQGKPVKYIPGKGFVIDK